MSKPKLELTWIGKDKQPVLEPRILIEDPEKSYGDKTAENMLIFGDNLLALKALEQDFAGKIKCACIDPPYNTGNAFDHYDDGLEHTLWLSLIKPRIELLHKLLRNDGTLWICIDDDECHYLKVLCDEIFGRKNFINNVIWEKKYTIANDAKWFSDNHDHILVYAKNKDMWRPNKLPRTPEMDKAYKNPDSHPKGLWKATPLHAKSGSERSKSFIYTFLNGITWSPPSGTFPRFSIETLTRLDSNNEIWFGKDGKSVPSRKTFMCDLRKEGTPSATIWNFNEVGHNHEAREEVKAINLDDVFATPKPERLIQRILTLATNENDWVLDSFLGSGTTDAVAHKMGRRWIGIELGEHCHTHCLPRLKKVVDGTDQGGISKAVNWKGGGGFKYYYLAPSLLKEDKYGNWIIDERYNADMLAAAMAKHEGFRYSPDPEIYWKQGRSTEKDYVFTTTQFVTVESIDKIHDELKPDESLLICCKSFSKACETRHTNITIRKIPNMLLGRCEFGREDYSLNIINMPVDEDAPDFMPAGPKEAKKKPEKTNSRKQRGLFGKEDDK
jgi:adenine-specific DNA-methyltransferase